MVKRHFLGLQIGTLNHPVTVKITELWAVKVKNVNLKLYSKPLSFNSK